jgi:hypothetical protein
MQSVRSPDCGLCTVQNAYFYLIQDSAARSSKPKKVEKKKPEKHVEASSTKWTRTRQHDMVSVATVILFLKITFHLEGLNKNWLRAKPKLILHSHEIPISQQLTMYELPKKHQLKTESQYHRGLLLILNPA